MGRSFYPGESSHAEQPLKVGLLELIIEAKDLCLLNWKELMKLFRLKADRYCLLQNKIMFQTHLRDCEQVAHVFGFQYACV